jgi:CheY-like chemotaxis protein
MAPRPEVETDPAPKCVMVVDDDAVIRMILAESMRDAGLLVIEASCSADAIGYLQSGAPVDLIFSDIQMAGPLDGLHLAHHVRAIRPSIPMLFTSAGPKPAALNDTEIFVGKPYRLDHVVATVTKNLGATGSELK